ncbi:unnamed protein product [Allacma fusca]|uniref:Cytochrome P450 n=1 Tax=Allacma fusca TaxID=39272 RepID=A0A8J2K0C3_9HEXA|nr:unnamed protein product [Allacma fusca]
MLLLMFVHGTIFAGLASFVLFLSSRKKRCNTRLPPAAWTTPLIGCLPVVLRQNIGEEMFKIGKQLGPVVSTHLGFQKFVIVNGPEAIKEAFRNSSIAGRADVLYKEFAGSKGIIWPDDVKETRKFIFKSSKHLEFTGNATEFIIQKQITKLLKRLEKTNGKPFLVKNIFNIPLVNGLFNLLLGTVILHDDPDFHYVITSVNILATLPDPIMRACVLCPSLLKWLPLFVSGRDKVEGYFNDVRSLVQKYAENRLVVRVPNQPRCMADALQDKIDETTNESSAFHHDQSPAVPILTDLVIGAIDTTAAMLEWIVLYLSEFPQVQQKVQTEMDKIVGCGRIPSLSDRPKMHYTLAVIQEIFRLAPVVPYGPRKATENTTLMGYTIEKDSYVVGNFYGINIDPDLWENPKEFKPERFLDTNGHFVKSDLLLIFGHGKRSCVGELSARDQIFLFTTRFLLKFNILPEKKLNNFSGRMAATWHCVDFEAKFVPRIQS